MFPIHVDADRRPDIAERYFLGGLPTTAFLDATGAIVGGGTFVAPDRMAAALTRAAASFASNRTRSRTARSPSRTKPGHPTPPFPRRISRTAVFDTYDEENGGFGVEPKFPLIAPIELATLDSIATRAIPRMAQIVERTLDAIGWGELFDEADGGFFRCAATRDWRQPRREKLLDVNASLLRAVHRSGGRAPDHALRWTAPPIYCATSRPGSPIRPTAAGPGHNGPATTIGRCRRSTPPVERDGGTSAALRASARHERHRAGRVRAAIARTRAARGYRPGEGVAHYVEDGRAHVRGLLDDQIAMASAQLDAHEATGNVVYEMMAQELMLYALRTMWDEERGGFFDRSVATKRSGSV